MGKVLKWIGIIIGGLIGMIILAVVVLYALGRAKFSQNANVGQPVAASTSAEAVARGDYLVHSVMGCEDCHGAGFRGNMFFDPALAPDGPPFGTLYAPNLTTGTGGIGSISDAEFERAIRHGIGYDGRTLFIMPANEYTHLADDDLGALLAYIRSVPPADNQTKPRDFSFMAYVMAGAGQLGPTPYERIDQQAAHAASMPASTSAEYGEYLSHIAACRDCHGPELGGAVEPGSGEATPNITATGDVGGWTAEQFLTALHTGATPDGHQLSDNMPWKLYGTMTDSDLTAIYNYLQTLSAAQ
jgi:mono/diheme cytochrome c family protein